jgi:hypothetical protein
LPIGFLAPVHLRLLLAKIALRLCEVPPILLAVFLVIPPHRVGFFHTSKSDTHCKTPKTGNKSYLP